MVLSVWMIHVFFLTGGQEERFCTYKFAWGSRGGIAWVIPPPLQQYLTRSINLYRKKLRDICIGAFLGKTLSCVLYSIRENCNTSFFCSFCSCLVAITVSRPQRAHRMFCIVFFRLERGLSFAKGYNAFFVHGLSQG